MNHSISSNSPSNAPPARSGCSLADLRVLVVGLGRFGGGVGVTRWLAGQRAVVTVTDLAGPETLAESIEAIGPYDLELHLGGHDLRDLDTTDLVVVNPAVCKSRSDFFQAIVRQGIPWTTELNLFCERCEAKVIGVTGTYGKSTTCAMLAEALKACQCRGGVAYTGVHLGGNFGRSLLDQLDALRRTDLVILEMSSAQLEDLPRIDWAPPVALITNLSPHHLDRYSSYAEYVTTKLNIVGRQRHSCTVLVGRLDEEAEAIVGRLAAERSARLVRVFRADPPAELRVPGEHNIANADIVLEICHHLGLDEAVVRDALRSFAGLPHRLEHVRNLDGVDYFNDSKSTSPAATVTAVRTLQQPIVVVVGGQDRGVDLASCVGVLADRCRAVICLGESGPVLASDIRAATGQMEPCAVCEAADLQEAVRLARKSARPGDAVLFSPGAPSFDAYANFAQRGRRFADAVNALS